MQLRNRTILITGGSSGIGMALARALTERGNTVLITGRDPARLASAAAAVPGVRTFRSDASNVADMAALHAEVTRLHPELAVLINNAGIMRNLDLTRERDVAGVTRELDINLSGPVRLVQQFLPHLLAQKEALIVNVSSGLAFVPLPISPVYCAAKAGLHSYSQSLRVQLRKTAVRVVELAPPGVDTPLFRDEFPEFKTQKAMAPEVLVARAIAGIESGHEEICPGQSAALRFMSRLAPRFILAQLARGGGA